MIRTALVLVAAFSFLSSSYADPIKKPAKTDSAKLARECCEAFIKAAMDGKADDAIACLATPFLEPDGMVLDSLDKFKRQFAEVPPPGFEPKIADVLVLDKFNDWAKKNDAKELNAEQLKKYDEFLGKEGRIVVLEVKRAENTPKDRMHMLLRVKEGKAKIVGVGR